MIDPPLRCHKTHETSHALSHTNLSILLFSLFQMQLGKLPQTRYFAATPNFALLFKEINREKLWIIAP